jgi:hypothetical protein
MCCQCVCECRESSCGSFEQNVIWFKEENYYFVEKISHPEMRDFFMACVKSVMFVIVHKTPNECDCADS